jgi:hypothetical protein
LGAAGSPAECWVQHRAGEERERREARFKALSEGRQGAAAEHPQERDPREPERVGARLENRYRALGKPDEFKANRDELVQEDIDDAAEQHHSRRDAPMRRTNARSFEPASARHEGRVGCYAARLIVRRLPGS